MTRALRIGRVVAVSGSAVRGVLSDGPAESNDLTVRIGALLRIETSNALVFGIVSALNADEPPIFRADRERRLVDIELLGEAMGGRQNSVEIQFQRGVSSYPALGADIYTATRNDLARIYARPAATNICVGSLFQDDQIPAYLITDDLLGKHFAVLGTTGVGKSCAVALILRAILDKHPYGHIVLLDPHNEYAKSFGDRAETLNPESLHIPYWLLNGEEAVQVIVGTHDADAVTQASILKNAIVDAKTKFAGAESDSDHLTVDTPVPYRLGDLVRTLDSKMGLLDKPESAVPYLRLKARIDELRSDRRYAFMFSGTAVRDDLADIMSRILRIPVAGKPLTIMDLSGVPSEIVDVVVSVLCRAIFDFAVWSEHDQATPVLVVCEEAQRYVPQDDRLGFGPTRRIISQIAKEGRKYGVSLCLVSQRPSELATSILSQCNTLFALRMTNEQDQDYVSKALPESAKGFVGSLASLRTRDAVVVGEGVTVPMRLRFGELPEAHRPSSGTAPFSHAWQQDTERPDSVETTINRWRRQQR